MTTTAEQIQELSAALDRDVTKAQERASEAVDNLHRAQEECEAAQKAILALEQEREGFRRTFGARLGLEPEPQEIPEVSHALQLVPPRQEEGESVDLASMTQRDQVKHILGDRTMTLDEIRRELEDLGLRIPNLSKVLTKEKDTVFASPVRGSWRVVETEEPSAVDDAVVLTDREAKVEMLANRRFVGARRQ